MKPKISPISPHVREIFSQLQEIANSPPDIYVTVLTASGVEVITRKSRLPEMGEKLRNAVISGMSQGGFSDVLDVLQRIPPSCRIGSAQNNKRVEEILEMYHRKSRYLPPVQEGTYLQKIKMVLGL